MAVCIYACPICPFIIRSVCLCICLSVIMSCLSCWSEWNVGQLCLFSTCLSVNVPICFPICLSIYLTVCKCGYFSTSPPACLSVFVSVCKSICFPTLYVCLYFCLSAKVPVYLFSYMFVCLPACLSYLLPVSEAPVCGVRPWAGFQYTVLHAVWFGQEHTPTVW